ncbi:hypothetical protein J6590_023099 [Homalodisca vitripennis]|nr:hypothetical protein J6590_023099 [Homalodisca vitripennis]
MSRRYPISERPESHQIWQQRTSSCPTCNQRSGRILFCSVLLSPRHFSGWHCICISLFGLDRIVFRGSHSSVLLSLTWQPLTSVYTKQNEANPSSRHVVALARVRCCQTGQNQSVGERESESVGAVGTADGGGHVPVTALISQRNRRPPVVFNSAVVYLLGYTALRVHEILFLSRPKQ